jgi:hypothetical protein
MNEKLKKISLKLSKRYKSPSLQDIYPKFMTDVKNNSDYFSMYDEKDYIKMIFYIHSLLETGGFEWGDGMIKNSWVGNYFEYGEDDFVSENCDDCNGNGDVECDYCDGSGGISCGICDDGGVECPDCDGDGVDGDGDTCSNCQGEGSVECINCHGEGNVDCNECGGDGRETCRNCGGSGDVDSSSLNYYNTTFITWDKDLIDMFMYSFELGKPTRKQGLEPEVEQDKMLRLITKTEEAEFGDDVKPDTIYCFNLQRLDEVNLFQSSSGSGIYVNGLSTLEEPDNYTI